MTVHYADDHVTIHVGDCRAVLATVEAESIQTVVTSPPYFGLRDYDAPGQLGLEATPDEYVAALVGVFREVRRVLRPDGTVWLNLGDSYWGTEARSPNIRADGSLSYRAGGAVRKVGPSLKPKDRMMMPARVAIALQADGWWLRDEIVWSKPNPMPSSVADRTTPAHEFVFLLAKRARYHYDGDAIRETPTSIEQTRLKVPGGWMVGPGTHSTIHTDGRTSATYREKTIVDPNARGLRQAPEPGEPHAFHPLGRNKRSVWTIATQAYPEAHFATFPEALVEPMILAGCPVGAVVLDPFGGSGTVAMVANRLGRRAVYIDLSVAYADQAIARIARSRASGEGPAVDMPVPFAGDGLWGEAVS